MIHRRQGFWIVWLLLQVWGQEALAQHGPGIQRETSYLKIAAYEALRVPESTVFARTSLPATASSSTPCSSAHHRA
ncbi:MAG: hypothetical protein L0177_16740, partial [Chloroflexi bacterium]|nr:hypothetical protein [Chloroflexota bacterium]